MTALSFIPSLALRPLHREWLRQALQRGRVAWRAAARRRAERREAMRVADALSGLDERLLRDVAAPEWLVARAAERAHRDLPMRIQAGRCEP